MRASELRALVRRRSHLTAAELRELNAGRSGGGYRLYVPAASAAALRNGVATLRAKGMTEAEAWRTASRKLGLTIQESRSLGGARVFSAKRTRRFV